MLKGLTEKRNALVTEMEDVLGSAKKEVRGFTDKESARVTEIKKEVRSIDATIATEEEVRNLDTKKEKINVEKRAAKDIFNDFIKGEERAAGEMNTVADGNIVPTELSADIIKKLAEVSGIFNTVRRVDSTGKYEQIVEKNKATAGWTDEMAEVTATDGDYEIVEIGHHKLGALTKLSDELVNQAAFNVTGEVTDMMTRSFAEKVEEAIIKGTGVKQPTGLVSGGAKVTLKSKTAITADELIDIFHAVKAPYLPKSAWVMNRNTLATVRKLKGTDGQYIFSEDMTKEFVGFVLGKPVLVSEFIDDLGATTNPIMFGDFEKAYVVNANPNQVIKVLREKYATQGAIGVLGFLYLDGKPVNDEAYVTAVCPA